MKSRSFASSGGDCHSRYTNNVFYHRLFPWILSFPEPFFYSFFLPENFNFFPFPWPLCSSLPWYFLLSFLSSFFILTLILMPVSLPFPLVLQRPHLKSDYFSSQLQIFFLSFPHEFTPSLSPFLSLPSSILCTNSSHCVSLCLTLQICLTLSWSGRHFDVRTGHHW